MEGNNKHNIWRPCKIRKEGITDILDDEWRYEEA